jgi:muconolactone D-isomerase
MVPARSSDAGRVAQGRGSDVEFIVHLQVNWPAAGDPAALARLTEAEHARAVELAAAGILRRLWRIPGRRANWGLWEAADPTELHAALTSLPFFPWLDAEVHAVARHPNDPPSWTDSDTEHSP